MNVDGGCRSSPPDLRAYLAAPRHSERAKAAIFCCKGSATPQKRNPQQRCDTFSHAGISERRRTPTPQRCVGDDFSRSTSLPWQKKRYNYAQQACIGLPRPSKRRVIKNLIRLNCTMRGFSISSRPGVPPPPPPRPPSWGRPAAAERYPSAPRRASLW